MEKSVACLLALASFLLNARKPKHKHPLRRSMWKDNLLKFGEAYPFFWMSTKLLHQKKRGMVKTYVAYLVAPTRSFVKATKAKNQHHFIIYVWR